MAATYQDVIRSAESMATDPASHTLAAKHGLRILKVTWEDTARFKNSAVGPNISDMTIQVQHQIPNTDRFELTCMPVIRFPNFSDLSADISPDLFFVLVGNEKGKPLEKTSLRQLLANPRSYLHNPKSWKGKRDSLVASERDRHVLVSAQACFLPIPKDGIAEFNPVLFNYQSSVGDPAVLTILATREGTSITIIDNQRDGFDAGRTWGQRLFFNQNGQRCSLTGKRKSDFLVEAKEAQEKGKASELEGEGLNLVLLIQVPLKQRHPLTRGTDYVCCATAGGTIYELCDTAMEDAVIGHGKVEGPFTEIDGLDIERDDRYPVRVTVQFYKATGNGKLSEADLAEMAVQIKRVYEQADYVGSLVVEGSTGRPTEYDGNKVEPPDWWDEFWNRHFANTGQTRDEAMQMLTNLLGRNWPEQTQEDVENGLGRARASRP